MPVTPAPYIAVAAVLAVTAAAMLAGSIIERPRNERGTRLRRWLRFHGTLK
jgi:peptidoglycan/LPS O-acetylase OafA/YrhL